MPIALQPRETWRQLLDRGEILQLPAAHDALTARLIQRAGFAAYQVGGFALCGARYGLPDVNLTHFGEESAGVREIIAASDLPVLVDADDGYGDVKTVTRVVRGYAAMGVSALFIEDQRSPKRCGHLSGQRVVPTPVMIAKIKAALAARDGDTPFLIARTDAIAAHGLDEALRRAEHYHQAGADGVYVEGPQTPEELERVGQVLGGIPLATSILEGGGKTPWVPPEVLAGWGYAMLLYPTTVLFRVAKAIAQALDGLAAGRPMPADDAVTLEQFEEILGLAEWTKVEQRLRPPAE
jgi:2-methylisocitrate lyase-like PEP mutase family enzyme